MKTWKSWIGRVLMILAAASILGAVPAELRVVVPATGVAALGYPRVFARLYANGRPLMGAAASPVLQQWQTTLGSWADLNLAEVEGPQTWYTAILDTGASSHLVTMATAERFGMAGVPGLFVHSEGNFGTLVSPLSYPYGLAVAGSRGALGEVPADTFVPAQEVANFAIDARARNPAQLIQLGGMNLIGMPMVRGYLFEIDPSALLPRAGRVEMPRSVEAFRALHTNSAGPSVRILPTGRMPTNGVLRLPLRFVQLRFVRQTLAGGRSPDLSESPVLIGVRAWSQGRWFVGNWLLDTGSPVSFISRRQALTLGWTPRAGEALSATNLTLQDISGTRQWRMAMRLDKLELRNPSNQVLEFQDATLLIQDVSMTQPDGSRFALDGLIGNNLLLPSVRYHPGEEGGEFVPAPFKRVFLDGFKAELGFEPHHWPTQAVVSAKTNSVPRRQPGPQD